MSCKQLFSILSYQFTLIHNMWEYVKVVALAWSSFKTQWLLSKAFHDLWKITMRATNIWLVEILVLRRLSCCDQLQALPTQRVNTLQFWEQDTYATIHCLRADLFCNCMVFHSTNIFWIHESIRFVASSVHKCCRLTNHRRSTKHDLSIIWLYSLYHS